MVDDAAFRERVVSALDGMGIETQAAGGVPGAAA